MLYFMIMNKMFGFISFRFVVLLPEYIINEEVDESSEDDLLDNNDDDSDDSENCEEIPKGSLQGKLIIHYMYIYLQCFVNFNTIFFVDVDGLDEALLEMAYGGDKDDEYFEKFKKAIFSVPEQIIRYLIKYKIKYFIS